MLDLIIEFALAVVPVVVAITLHEAAHGYAAWALGDDTAKRLGRLSLNPLAHVDRVGTILLPGFLLVSQLLTIGHVEFMFGWAKPVPVDVRRLPNPRRGMMLVAAAGPLMNFFLAWLTGLALHLMPYLHGAARTYFGEFAALFILVNLVLAMFNLIPIPPLDGGRIAVGLLPLPLARAWAGLERFGLLIVLLMVFLLPMLARDLGYNIDPVRQFLTTAEPWATRWILFLSGHGRYF